MLKETGAGLGVETMQKNLSIDREYERIRNQLRAEFEQIDLNQDGTIECEEIVRFLNEKTNGKVDTEIATNLYRSLDVDGSGRIMLEEFIDAYFEQQREVKECIMQIEEELKVYESNREQILVKLKDQRKKERLNNHGIDDDSILTCKLIEARNLTPMGIQGLADPYAVLQFDNQIQKSKLIKKDLNPVWNEVFTFDVIDG